MGKAWKPHYITAASSSLGRVFTELVTGDPCLSTPSPSSSELTMRLMQFTENYRDRILSNPKPITKDLDLDFPPMIEFLDKYQDPRQADVAFQIMQDLDQTKEVMYKTIDQVLKRGESLESIMAKSEDLSGASMKFYQTSKKTRCCTIL